jgi:hypothetical protein
VDDSSGTRSYRRIDALDWQPKEIVESKMIKIKGFPKDPKVRLFRVAVSIHRTDGVATNDRTQIVTAAVQKARKSGSPIMPKVSPAPSPGVIDDARFA